LILKCRGARYGRTWKTDQVLSGNDAGSAVIVELNGVLEALKQQLTRSELIHADMTAQVSTATDEIRLISRKLLAQNNAAKSEID
jgi:hypothetical protein